jgi:hypothetical protein
MKRLHLAGLALIACSVCSCSKPGPAASLPFQTQEPAGLQDSSTASNPAEEQRLRDEANRNYSRWNYQPAERKAYEP